MCCRSGKRCGSSTLSSGSSTCPCPPMPRTRTSGAGPRARHDCRVTDELTPWHVHGTYLEACNCDPICPCRRIGGRAGGRSTHGVCLGALSWSIEEGRAGRVELGGLSVVMGMSYSDDEEGSPWTLV